MTGSILWHSDVDLVGPWGDRRVGNLLMLQLKKCRQNSVRRMGTGRLQHLVEHDFGIFKTVLSGVQIIEYLPLCKDV